MARSRGSGSGYNACTRNPTMTHHTSSHEATGEGSVEDRMGRLPSTVEALGGPEEHRRDSLVEAAEARGLDRPDAEQAYDIAREVGLDPAYGVAVVLEGLSVRPLSSPRPDVDTSEPAEPEWVDAPPDPGMAERERRLRQTFRRLRSHLGGGRGLAEALETFARDPDLEAYDY